MPIETDDIESRLFDLTALKMQLASAEGDTGTFEQLRRRVVEIAMLLEEKSTIPAVVAQLAYLASVQENAFWEGVALDDLEDLRLRLRGLVPFLDKKTRKVVYTDFEDDILSVRGGTDHFLPKMTGAEYEKKVQEYLAGHLDHIVIHRLRTNQPLTDGESATATESPDGSSSNCLPPCGALRGVNRLTFTHQARLPSPRPPAEP